MGAVSVEPSSRERLALRSALLRCEPALETVAEDVLGAVSRIDLVASDARGAVSIVLAATEGSDLARLAEGIAHCAWLAPRLADWQQLAPHLRLDPARGVRLLLAAPHFDERTRLAAASWTSERVDLMETFSRGDGELVLRPLRPTTQTSGTPGSNGRARPSTRLPAPGFRTALRD